MINIYSTKYNSAVLSVTLHKNIIPDGFCCISTIDSITKNASFFYKVQVLLLLVYVRNVSPIYLSIYDRSVNSVGSFTGSLLYEKSDC